MWSTTLVLSLAASLVSTVSAIPAAAPQMPSRRSALPSAWAHPSDHPVHDLFRRQSPLPVVGSPEWAAQYPKGLPETNIPAPWLAALKSAVAANLIPNIPLATSPDGGSTAVYAPDANAGHDPICSSQFQCRAPDDVWDAPDGTIGLSVDDGPVGIEGASGRLYDFLKANNQKVTHFMIGQNILFNPTVFLRAFQELDDDIGCHTWTHRHMSLLTNEQLVADLGWTMQIIHDSTGGRVPRYWRPPYGDSDNRVRAIAKHVFGMTTVIWNQDSQDWTMAAGRTTLPAIQAAFQGWLNGPRSPGLIVLEHEIAPDDVTAFINMYPLIAAATGGAAWQPMSVAQLFDGHVQGTGPGARPSAVGWYQNAADNNAAVTSMDIIAAAGPIVTSSASPSSSAAAAGNATAPTGSAGAQAASGTPTTVRSAAGHQKQQTGFALVGSVFVAVAALAVSL